MARTFTMALVLAAAILGVAMAQPTTLNTRYDSYTYVSNVIGYVNMTADYCDIQTAVQAGNWSTALDIYANGKNSFSGVSRRTFFRFASYAVTDGTKEPLHDSLGMGRNALWLDALIRDAFAKRNGTLALGLIQVAVLKYFLHEVDQGYTKTATYLADPVNNTALIADATGAPHNVDEAFALWAGGSTRACATLSGWAARFGADMETTFLGRSYINAHMTIALNDILAASRMATLPAYNTTRYGIQRALTVMGLQGVVHSAFRVQAATGCKRTAADIRNIRALITVHWTYLRPMLAFWKVPDASVAALRDAVFSSKPHFTKTIQPALRTVATALGLRSGEIGAPVFERVVPAAWNCKSTVMARRLMA